MDDLGSDHRGLRTPSSCPIITSVETNNPMSISADYIIESLQAVYGESVTAADIRAWCAMNGSNYQTITNKLTDYKIGRGSGNLEVTKETVKDLEVVIILLQSFLQLSKTLSRLKMIPSSALVTSLILKKLLRPAFSIRRSLLVFLVMVRRSLSNKRVPNSGGNSSA